LLSGRENIQKLKAEYAEGWIFPEDRETYRKFVDFDTIEDRLNQSGLSYVSVYLRSNIRHGRYAWKKYILLRVRQGVYVELIRNVHEDLVTFEREHGSVYGADKENDISPDRLWYDLIQSDIARLFWKDSDRRFLGASRGFLDYYGFDSVEDILGKTDEDLGWHVHPDAYMYDELRVIQEGITTHNVPGRCICHGDNREIVASKTPLYDDNGEVRGLMGWFIDRNLLSRNDSRGNEISQRDLLTGLLNDRGINDQARAFRDEYDLRGIDFVRIHVSIDDFSAICRQYGFEFGDKAILALGKALKEAFGLTAAVGRHSGHEFVLLRQIHETCEVLVLEEWIRTIAAGIQQIDGVPVTLYLSVGSAMYSSCEDLEEQRRLARPETGLTP
jgi:diguanylate cyclase (GGDEF)-like protein